MQSANTDGRGKVMSNISPSRKVFRERRTVRVLAASALLVLAGALLPAAANAYVYPQTKYFTDGTNITLQAACTPKTWANPAPTTWFETAMQTGPNLNYGAIGYPTAYVKFGIWNIGRARWAAIDSSWRAIPKTILGLRLSGGWSWWSGTFSVWAMLNYRGWTYGWYQIGSMHWNGGLCFDYF
jgi:hypothetical protein